MILPLSKTIIVVLVLYYGVAHWNEFMNGLIYLRDEGYHPLQLTLRGILLQNQVSGLGDVDSILEQQKAAELLKIWCYYRVNTAGTGDLSVPAEVF